MSDTDSMIFGHPAQVATRATSDELLVLAKKRAPDPSSLDEMQPFFFSAEVSNNKLDAYFTKMAPSSLKNYAADAEAGVSFQNSHRCDDIGIGYSLTGTYSPGGAVAKVIADFYTVRGLSDTDAFIAKLRSGLARDVSIGFYGGKFICSICGRDMLRDWDCFHMPGWEEEVEADGKVRKEVAWASVEDAHLAETSIVYDGATPGAAILKAQQEAINGRIRPEAARFIEQRYRINLPDKRVTVPVGNLQKEGDEMNELEILQRQVADVRGILKGASVPDDKPLDVAVRELIKARTVALETEPPNLLTEAKASLARAAITAEVKNVPEAMRLMESELTRLRPLADDGTTYRKDLIEAAVKEGARAHGDKWKEETQRAWLGKLDLEDIKITTDQWRRIGDSLFPGGRVTTDGDEPKSTPETDSEAPLSAYKIN